MPVITGVQGGNETQGLIYPCVSDALQQSASFVPFVGKFVGFLLIARRTCSDNIGYIIAASSRNGNNMVSMPYKILLGMPFLAIVTLVTLAFQLLQELLTSERIASIMAGNTAFMTDCSSNCSSTFTAFISFFCLLSMFGLSVLSTICCSLFFVLLVILPSKFSMIFSVRFIALCVISKPFFFMLLLPFSIIFLSLFFIFLIIQLILLTCTCSTFISEFCFLFAKASKRKNLFADAALLAFGGILRYDVTHGKANSLSSRQRVFAAPLWQHIITSTFYHKSASQATSCSFYCPVSSFLEA